MENPTNNLCEGFFWIFCYCLFVAGLSSVWLPPEVLFFVGSSESKSNAQFMCGIIFAFFGLWVWGRPLVCVATWSFWFCWFSSIKIPRAIYVQGYLEICLLCVWGRPLVYVSTWSFIFCWLLSIKIPRVNYVLGNLEFFLHLDRGRPLVYVAEADKIPPAVSANLISMLILIWMIFYFLAKSRSACGFSLVCFPFIFPLWSLPGKSLSKPAGVQILDLWRDIALGMVCVTGTCVRVATVRSRPYKLTTHTQPSTDTHLPNMHAFLKKYPQPRTYWPHSPMHKHNHPHTCAKKITQLHIHTHHVYKETRALSHTKHALLNTCTFSQTQSATRTYTNTDTNTDQDTSYSPYLRVWAHTHIHANTWTHVHRDIGTHTYNTTFTLHTVSPAFGRWLQYGTLLLNYGVLCWDMIQDGMGRLRLGWCDVMYTYTLALGPRCRQY